MKFLIPLFAATLLFSFNSQAEYIKLGLGMNLDADVELETSGSSSKPDLEAGFLTSPILIAYGFELGELMSEVEFAHRSTKYDGANAYTTKINSLAYNLVYLHDAGTFNWNGGVGPTIGLYDLQSGDDSEYGLGVQLFGGADFKINNDFAIGGELRYFTTLTEIELGATDATFSQMALIATARMGF